MLPRLVMYWWITSGSVVCLRPISVHALVSPQYLRQAASDRSALFLPVRFAHRVHAAAVDALGAAADAGAAEAGRLCAEGEVELACVRAEDRRPARLPEALAELLAARVGPPGRIRRD